MATPDDAQLVCRPDVLGFESQMKRFGLAGLHTKYEALIDSVKQQKGNLIENRAVREPMKIVEKSSLRATPGPA